MPKDPKKNSRLLPVSNVLQSLLANGKSPLSEQFIRWKLWRNWPEIVGPTLAKNCQPVGFRKGRLYVWVKSAPYLQEMRFMIGSIKDKINKHLEREWVKYIQLTLDKKSVPDQQEASESFKDFIDRS